MKTRSIVFYVVTLIMALCMSQNVMAKKVIYMGHEYDGKVNKEKIPEGKGTIQIAELSISGIFNGSVITNASFQTTWLSYKGDVIFYDNDIITLKDGGTITLNIYNGGWRFDSNKIEHQDVNVDGDMNVDYQKLKLVPYKLSVPIEPLDERLKSLNPPTDTTINVLPEDHTFQVNINVNTVGDKKIFIYKRNISPRKYNLISSEGHLYATLNNYKDSEGRVWKKYRQGYQITFPDGSYCDYSTGYNRKYPRQIPIYKDGEEYIYIDDQPFCLKLRYGTAEEKDDKIIIKADSYTGKLELVLKKTISGHSDYREYDGVDKIIKEKVIPYISVQDGAEMKIGYIASSDAMNNYVEYVASYKNGVFLDQKGTEQAETKKAAAEKAAHNAKTASFKKKYGFDPSVNDIKYIVKVGRNILNIVDARNEWVDKYADNRNNKVTVKLLEDQGASKCYKFYWFNTAYFCGYFWVRNNVITSITWE